MSRDEAEAAVLPIARRQMARPIRLIGPRGETQVTGTKLGARPLLDVALDEAIAPGARERLLRRIGLGDTRAIPLVYRIGPVRAAELANRLDDSFGEEPQNADLEVAADGTSVAITTPAPGTVVDRAALRKGLRSLPAEIGVPLVTRAPSVGTAQAELARARVVRLLDGPREVRFRDAAATLPVATLAGLVTTQPAGGRLAVGLDADGLREALRPSSGAIRASRRRCTLRDERKLRQARSSVSRQEARRRADRSVARRERRCARPSRPLRRLRSRRSRPRRRRSSGSPSSCRSSRRTTRVAPRA